MSKKISVVLAGAALVAGSMLVTAAPASAAHCVEGGSPGFSYFGTVHVQEATHAEGGKVGPHMGTSGASSCRDTTGSPSERAPGRR